MEIPSFTLSPATSKPLNCAFIRLAIANPDALSLAWLILYPDDKRSSDLDNAASFLANALFAIMEDTL